MRTRAAVLPLLVIGTLAPAAPPPRLSGSWALEFQRDVNVTYVADCVWDHQEERLSGGCTSGFGPVFALRGRVIDAEVTMSMTFGPDVRLTIECGGRLNDAGTQVSGEWRSVDADGRREGGRFTASKRPAAADSSGSPR